MPKSKTSKKSAGKSSAKEKPFQEQLEEWSDSLVDFIKYDRLRIWKEVLFHPAETFEEQIETPSFKRGAKDVFVADLIPLIFGLIGIGILLAYLLVIGVFATLLTAGVGLVFFGALIVGGLLLIILYLASPIIMWIIHAALQFLIAKLFGSKANFRTHAYAIALAQAASSSATSLFILAEFIPCIGYVAQYIIALIGIYSIYLNYKAVRIVHGFDTLPALAVVLIPIAIFMVALVGLLMLVYFGGILLWLSTMAAVVGSKAVTK